MPIESIDAVVLTHAHPDHLGGLLDPTTGAPAFPNAEIIISNAELEFWTGDDAGPALDRILDASGVIEGARAVLGAVEDRLRVIRAGDEMLILGCHFPFPGLGYALPYGDAYRWHPAGWTVLT